MAMRLNSVVVKRIKNAMIAHNPAIECHYCGMKLNRGLLTLDHVVPLSAGGERGLRNIVPACRRCNGTKGNKSYSEFVRKIDPNCSFLRAVPHG